MKGIWHILTRRKVLDETTDLLKPSKLARRLTTFDLIALGVGSTLGVGVYVLAGHVAKDAAGPSVILSFLIAAIASLFAGLCYAEFGARVPRAGSAYVYSYVCVGEFIAFIIGWNLILEYVIGSASVSRGISLYLDTLLNDTLKSTFREITPINVSFMSDYFDLLAFGLSFVLGGMLAFGLKESTMVNNAFTVLNICVVIFVIIVGSLNADINNWHLVPDDSNSNQNVGKGGFFPFGFAGTLKGAATCFFGFVGFDCIATTGEEVHNPKRAIPLSIITSLGIIFLAYFGISTVLTLMWPYYLQDANAPIPYVLGQVGWEWAKWAVAIGGIFGLLASLFGSLFPLPRILYAMASDGLVFRFFGEVSSRFHTPVFGTLLATLLTGIMAGLFELSHLVNMMSIGTLMAYTIVAACVLLLRYNSMYEPFDKDQLEHLLEDSNETYSLLDAAYYDDDFEESVNPMTQVVFESSNTIPILRGDVIVHETSYLMNQHQKFSCSKALRQLFNCSRNSHPDRNSSIIVGSLIFLYCLFCIAFGLCLMYLIEELTLQTTWAIVITSLFGFFIVICIILISIQPRSKTELSFQVPWVPLVPCISIFINIYLMLMLDVTTWIRFGVWMAIGLTFYIMSLCVYDRGGDYLMYAQKSSVDINNTTSMNGKLNYAFENTEECQERATSFVPDFVEERQYLDAMSIGARESSNVDKYVKKNEFDDVQNGIKHESQQPVMKSIPVAVVAPNNNKSATENQMEIIGFKTLDDHKITNYEEIELLDKVIKDEEEAAGMSPILDHTESYPISNTSFRSSFVSSNGDGDDQPVSSEHSVVALVHRENTLTKHKDQPSAINNLEVLFQSQNGEDSSEFKDDQFHFKFDDQNNDQEENNENEWKSSGDESVNDNQDISMNFSNKNVEKSDTNIYTVKKSPNPSKTDVFIPPPPPMNEEYFSKTLPTTRFKVVKYDNDDRPAKKEPKNVREKSAKSKVTKTESKVYSGADMDTDERLKFGTHKQNVFMNKLDFILSKNKKRPSQRGNVISMTEDSLSNRQNSIEVERHKSEPDLVAALKQERADTVKNLQEPDIDTENLIEANDDKNNEDNNSLNKTEEENDAMSKDQIKRKLEALFSSNQSVVPPTIRRKNWNEAYELNEAKSNENSSSNLEEDTPEIIKPKKSDNYTNTMKLQRARFGDVLKSIELKKKQDSDVDSDDDPEAQTSL